MLIYIFPMITNDQLMNSLVQRHIFLFFIFFSDSTKFNGLLKYIINRASINLINDNILKMINHMNNKIVYIINILAGDCHYNEFR